MCETIMKSCYKCSTEWLEKHTPGFRDECEKCFTPLHCCMNCRFYKADSSQWCNEPAARDEKPKSAEEANKCSFFLMADSCEKADAGREPDAKKKLHALFGEDASEQESSEKPDWMKVDDSGKKDLNMIFKPPDKK